MMIVIGGPGTGKSMLAVNLASYWHGLQRRVLLIDADPRLASMQWGSRASLRQAPCPAIMGAVMAPWDTLRQLSFDYKIVDLGFGLGPAWDEALRYADLVLLPTQARLGEIEHLKVAVKAIERESIARPSLCAAFVLNRARHSVGTRSVLRSLSLPTLVAALGENLAFSEAFTSGMGITDWALSSDSNAPAAARLAANEIEALAGELVVLRARSTVRLVSANEPKSDQTSRSQHERSRRPRSPARTAGPQSFDDAGSARENRRAAQRHHMQKNFSGEQMWQSMEENAFDHVSLVDRQGTFLYINRAAPGWQVEDLVHKAKLTDALAPEDHALVQSSLAQVFERGQSTFYEVRIPATNTWYANVVAPVRREDKIIAASIISRECGAQKRAEKTMRAAQALSRAIAETSAVGLWVVDAEGITSMINARTAEILGQPVECVVGRSLCDFVDEDSRNSLLAAMSGRNHGRSDAGEVRFRRADGEVTRARVSRTPHYDDRGALVGSLLVLNENANASGWAREFAQGQRMEAVGRLAGCVAHDFDNLLTTIMGFGNLLAESVVGNEQAELQVGRVLDAANRASKLARQLQTLAHRKEESPRVVDLNLLVQSLASLLQSTLPREATLTVTWADAPCCVRADPGRVEQALLNLVINARDAIETHGHVEVLVDPHLSPEEQLQCSSNSCVALRVKDDGTGIPDSVADHIFEPFFSTKGEEQGTGLGLSIVASIMKESDGCVSVKTAQGRGTVLSLLFPVVAAPDVSEPNR